MVTPLLNVGTGSDSSIVVDAPVCSTSVELAWLVVVATPLLLDVVPSFNVVDDDVASTLVAIGVGSGVGCGVGCGVGAAVGQVETESLAKKPFAHKPERS